MKPYKVEKTETTPIVHLDKEKSIFKIEGMSITENAFEFYEPIINWLNEYAINPNDKTIFEINITYFNSVSALYIAKVIKVLKDIYLNKKDVILKWFYNEDDSEMQEHGIGLETVFKIPIELIQNKQ